MLDSERSDKRSEQKKSTGDDFGKMEIFSFFMHEYIECIEWNALMQASNVAKMKIRKTSIRNTFE